MCVGGAVCVGWDGGGAAVVVVMGGVGLLSRIHFPPDHNAIIVGLLYCASQHMHAPAHMHTNTSYSV